MIKVTEGIYRGPRPLSLEDIPGIKTVVSLESGWFEVFHDDMYAEDVMDEKGGVRILHVPMNSVGLPPSYESLYRTYRLLVNPTLHPVYLHCKQGVDRTGLAIAFFRKQQGWSTEKALEEMLARGFHKWRYFYWIWWFKIFC